MQAGLIVAAIPVVTMTATADRMRRILLIVVAMFVIMVGCGRSKAPEHKGIKSEKDVVLMLDSIIINADSTSLRGNFMLLDSALMFVDQHYCRVFSYSISDGELIDTFSRYGQGPDEMTGILYGSPINPQDTMAWIMNSSNGVFVFSPESGHVDYKGILDFGWDSQIMNDYESTSCYNIMEMSDFGVTMTKMNDSTVMLPLSLIHRNIEKVNKQRYDKGHIFGLVDSKTLKVRRLIGNYPENLKLTPTPFFDFFDYSVDFVNSRIYTSFASDSLIYCSDFQGKVLYAFGYEPSGIDRKYTLGYDTTIEDFRNDISHVGINTGIYLDPENEMIFRCSMTDFASGVIKMQIYKDSDLIAELSMPPYFKLLGKIGAEYYGVRFLPLENEDNSHFVMYRFSIKI